ncbi:MAG: SGNH/GDSL hydrolase N-terminal domain-containing protein [Odoribacter sp.]
MPHMPATGVSGVDLYTKDGNGKETSGVPEINLLESTISYQFKDLNYRNGHQEGTNLR